MICPIDGEELRISDRQGVEIDYCPKCRGVWLDRGELDKIIEKVGPTTGRGEPVNTRESSDYQSERYEGGSQGGSRQGSSAPRKRRSMLSELFDFD